VQFAIPVLQRALLAYCVQNWINNSHEQPFAAPFWRIWREVGSVVYFSSACRLKFCQPAIGVPSLNNVQIFGATENDIDDLRILSLHEVDIDKLDEMARGED
jgi:hypothetical protein